MSTGTDDNTAYSDYVAARWASLYRTANLIAGDPNDAEDVLQATLVKVYLKWEQITSADSVDAYVRRMLLNELLGIRRLQLRRREKAHLLHESEAPGMDATERIGLWSEISALPPRQRAVLVLRYYEDLSEQQTADALGCSRGTVKSQAHDALSTLRNRLSADEEVPR